MRGESEPEEAIEVRAGWKEREEMAEVWPRKERSRVGSLEEDLADGGVGGGRLVEAREVDMAHGSSSAAALCRHRQRYTPLIDVLDEDAHTEAEVMPVSGVEWATPLSRTLHFKRSAQQLPTPSNGPPLSLPSPSQLSSAR